MQHESSIVFVVCARAEVLGLGFRLAAEALDVTVLALCSVTLQS